MLQESLDANVLIERTTLPNGLTVLTEKIPNVRSLSLGLWVLRGSRHEPRERSGIFHFIEHSLFKGTESRDTKAIARVIDSIGGEMNAFTGKETTCFYARVLDEHLDVAVDLLADLVLHPTFLPIDIERERRVILEEIKMVDDTPDDLVHNLFIQAFWKGNPLARPILGTRRTVAAVRPEVLREFFLANIRPNNLLIAASGSVEHDPFVDRMWRAFRELEGTAPELPIKPPTVHPTIRLKNKPGLKQTYLCLGTRCYERNHPDRYALSVLNTILGTGMSSRLFQRIREEKSLAYDVASDTVSYHDAGYLVVYAGTAAESVREVIDIVLEEFRLLKLEPVAPDELARAKEHLKGSLMLGLESTFNRMSNLATQDIYFGKQYTLDEILEGIDRVTTGDVLRVALDVFDEWSLSLAVLGKLPEGFTIERASIAG